VKKGKQKSGRKDGREHIYPEFIEVFGWIWWGIIGGVWGK